MPEIGQTISHYKILKKIGHCGMDKVYLAKDLSLDRRVALKFLPNVFTGDPERMARFEREAKLLASLNHLNIAAIHGLEESEGTHFLVLELFEGYTLEDRSKHGAIPVGESLKLALQIAEALEAAHEKGAIHRDLKPANIMVMDEGSLKLFDSGLAKLDEQHESVSGLPMADMPATQASAVLGTIAYISREQTQGQPAEWPSEIFSFGLASISTVLEITNALASAA